ncbi:hypothetical protein [Pseudonocardia hydrocarbonoxydans]|uniref:Uncharacterized protein n=1 Tax=Pseudonocardia hydrocarbonoxydans TaxID=76726 RepID=A0A4Y3WUC4_9PSEU|nr:hypothetical protein [Pseudonocardia hydrocarbonoxydans]GEC22138.1 hypothetical protein PHY01_44210 [Pseudonocardia hydrocarbonoxydans]
MTDQTDQPDDVDQADQADPPQDDRAAARATVAAMLADRQALAEDGVALSDTSDIAEAIRARRDRKENR